MKVFGFLSLLLLLVGYLGVFVDAFPWQAESQANKQANQKQAELWQNKQAELFKQAKKKKEPLQANQDPPEPFSQQFMDQITDPAWQQMFLQANQDVAFAKPADLDNALQDAKLLENLYANILDPLEDDRPKRLEQITYTPPPKPPKPESEERQKQRKFLDDGWLDENLHLKEGLDLIACAPKWFNTGNFGNFTPWNTGLLGEIFLKNSEQKILDVIRQRACGQAMVEAPWKHRSRKNDGLKQMDEAIQEADKCCPEPEEGICREPDPMDPWKPYRPPYRRPSRWPRWPRKPNQRKQDKQDRDDWDKEWDK